MEHQPPLVAIADAQPGRRPVVAVGVVGVRPTALGAGALIAGAGVLALRASRSLPEPTQPTDPVIASSPDPVTIGPAPG